LRGWNDLKEFSIQTMSFSVANNSRS